MKQLDKKYYNLSPKFTNLYDKFVLSLAWKKTDLYIRSHNWYAELLSLDKCTFNINRNTSNWSKYIASKDVKNTKIELIPAPKTAKWFFKNNKWQQKQKDINFRPLANILIKEQSILTAIMMCLADSFESRQKDCSIEGKSYLEHLKNKVYSYGNRLVCDWEEEIARFRWGGSEFYRKFSSDYRVFLQRPIYIGRYIQQKISALDDIYIVNLDLSNFYGSIKHDLLVNKLKKVANEHYKIEMLEDDNFWSITEKLFKWDWSEESLKLAKELDIPHNIGIPQGLASAGAFSNIYLIDFDESIGANLNKYIPNSSIFIHDYCRYVDDIRIVISGESLDKNQIIKTIHDYIQSVLDKTLEHNDINDNIYLKINTEKTKIIEISNLDNSSSLTNRINEIHNEIGPSSIPERNTIEQNIPALQQFLFTEQDDDFDNGVDNFINLTSDKNIKIESLRKFSAYRLHSSLLQKVKIISPDEKAQLRNESIFISKKLVKAWLKDPSIMILLRKALEINPSIDGYKNIFDVIFKRIKSNSNKKDRYIMIYILSDIFRSISDIYRDPRNDKEIYSDLISLVTSIAQKIILSNYKLPIFIFNQASFLLSIVNKTYITNKKISRNLLKLNNLLLKKEPDALAPCDSYLFEISAQISNEYYTYANFLIENTINNIKLKNKAINNFALNGGYFWSFIWQIIKEKNYDYYLNKYRWAGIQNKFNLNGNTHFLSTIISSEYNPFKYEHTLIKLGICLSNILEKNENKEWSDNGNQASPHEIKIKLKDNIYWEDLWKTNSNIECEIKRRENNENDPRYRSPKWLEKDKNSDGRKIYWICSILRAASLGRIDFTQRIDLNNNTSSYNGIRTHWYRRQLSMLHTPESLVGTYATIGDWFAKLLQHGLQWPGFSSSYIKENDILSINNLNDFKNILNNRLSYLNSIICNSSSIPSIPTVIKKPELINNLFRIVTVQQLFPKEDDFHLSDPMLNNINFRWKHREHLTEICKLTEQTLNIKLKNESSYNYKSTADLIIFSELAVHPNDEDILQSLAFRTKAIIFAGFIFTENDGKIINKARWIIPDNTESGIQWRIRDQGKFHMTPSEECLGIEGYRPCQHIIEIEGHPEGPFKLTGSICYDATDIKLAADLRDKTDMFVIAAYNKDVNTFDNMASALQWHMYQHVIIANTGQYGGSTMQAPYKEMHHKLISHTHGSNQLAISTADIDLAAFRRKVKKHKETKTHPAGFKRKY
ncbi:Reverse transcriptase (RNA-dependent DNA polymerase) [Proteus mirabilis]|nr:Reverse transcriptase (RNA-dependent DNA polymerase) [Proteus mirabilis]MBG2768070.1 Reverse transcriptase (RNA-dependent DNA polymerase) [Proteus mirabilis]